MNMSQWVGVCMLLSSVIYGCSEVSEFNEFPSNSKTEKPKEFNDRTRVLREILLKGTQFPMTPTSKLLNRYPDWYIQGDNFELKKVILQGISNKKLLGNFVYVRTDGEDGQWYRFYDVPEAFKQYLATLPMLYDDTNLSFDSHEWYVRDDNKTNRKLVQQVDVTNNTISVIGEDGRTYKFKNEVKMNELGDYVKQLPKEVHSSTSAQAAENVYKSSYNVLPLHSETGKPKKFNEGTQALREVLLKGTQFPMTPSDKLLYKFPDWYIQGDHFDANKVVMQGISNKELKGNFTYLRTDGEDGQWYRFCEVPEAFKQYLATLPLLYDDTNLLFDSHEWYIPDANKTKKKLVQQVDVGNNTISVVSENGRTYSFKNEIIMNELRDYVKRLPKCIHSSTLVQKAENVNESSCNVSRSLTSIVLTSFKTAVLSSHKLNASDSMAFRQNCVWYIKQNGTLLKLVKYGHGLQEQRRPHFAQTEDGKWHKFLNAPQALVQYLKGLPKLYYYGEIASDGKAWYVQDKNNEFKKLVKFGSVDYHIVTALSDDNMLYTFHLNSKYSNLLLTYLFTLPVYKTSKAELDASRDRLRLQEERYGG